LKPSDNLDTLTEAVKAVSSQDIDDDDVENDVTLSNSPEVQASSLADICLTLKYDTGSVGGLQDSS
jgi:hypothetical protein